MKTIDGSVVQGEKSLVIIKQTPHVGRRVETANNPDGKRPIEAKKMYSSLSAGKGAERSVDDSRGRDLNKAFRGKISSSTVSSFYRRCGCDACRESCPGLLPVHIPAEVGVNGAESHLAVFGVYEVQAGSLAGLVGVVDWWADSHRCCRAGVG